MRTREAIIKVCDLNLHEKLVDCIIPCRIEYGRSLSVLPQIELIFNDQYWLCPVCCYGFGLGSLYIDRYLISPRLLLSFICGTSRTPKDLIRLR
jgi:hypothetical protein